MAFGQLNAQEQRNISGKIISAEDGIPLVGATLQVKGVASSGTITDLDGNFIISAKSGDVLMVSYVGFIKQEIAITNQASLTFKLIPQTTDIDEVVVVGYGSTKKSLLTGAISSIKNDDMDQVPVSRVDEALVGQVSGTTIQMTDATAGGTPTIRVRGIGSITADASPLIVYDGVVVSSDFLGSIDMNTVASIEVLKDAASAAIYGSRGGNGIIMITSKKGLKGKPVLAYNAYVGYKFTPKFNSIPTISEWEDYVKANNDGNLTDRFKYIDKLGTETNWTDVMFDGGFIQNHSLSVRGGTDKTSYQLSGAYLDDGGVLLTDRYTKSNLNLYLKSKINNFIEVGLRVNPSYAKKQVFPIGIHDAVRQSPWLPLYLDENTIQYVNSNYPDAQVGDYAKERMFDNYDLYGDGSDVDISTTSNVSPYAKVLERDYHKTYSKLFSNAYIKLHLAKGLDFKSNFGLSYRHNENYYWTGSKAHRNGIAATASEYNTYNTQHLVNENLITYSNTFGKHDINAVAGLAFEAWDSHSSEQEGDVYNFDYIRTLNAASIMATSNTYASQERMNSVLGRVNYSYAGKYLFSLSLRYDGSSKFGSNTRYGFFPAASVGWRITEENFMKNIDFISNLKARFSYGVTGTKDGISNYQHMSLLEPVTAVFNGSAVSGFNAVNIANPDLGWEQTVEYSPGLDFGFMKNKLFGSADFYQRQSLSLLLDKEIPSVTGFTTALVNIGKVKNTGYELELTGIILDKSALKWSLTGNFSHNVNELMDFAGSSGLISSVDAKRPAEYIALEGYPISAYYGYVYDKDIPLENLKNPFYPIGAKSQDVYVKDLNGDGIIDTDDRAIIGFPFPKYVWSVSNKLRFRGLDFSFMFQASYGAKVRNMDPQYLENQFSSNQDYITDVNDPNYFTDGDKVKQRFLTDLYVQDASYISLRNINLGYSLPTQISEKAHISKARFYVAANNLLYFMSKDYTSFNPEGVTYDDNPLQGGYQRGAAPIYKTISFGLNLEF